MMTEHQNHFSKEILTSSIPPEQLITSITELTEDQKNLFVKLYKGHTPIPCIRQMLQDEGGVAVPGKVLENLHRALGLDSVKTTNSSDKSTSNIPPTAQLMLELMNQNTPFLICFQVLKQRNVIKEVSILKLPLQSPVLIAEICEKESVLFNILKKKNYSNSDSLPSSFHVSSAPQLSTSGSTIDFIPESQIGFSNVNATSVNSDSLSSLSPQTLVETFGNEWEFLFPDDAETLKFNGCVWSDEMNLISASLYPEVIQVDTTCKTNLYNYPLTFVVGVNGENKTQNWITGLLPDQKRKTFIWLLDTVLPIFLGHALLSVQTIISDGDNQLMNAIQFCISSSSHYDRKVCQLLCFWHTVSLVISNKLGFLGSVNCASLKYYCKIIADCQSQQQVEEYWKEINDFLDKVTQHKSVFARNVMTSIKSKQQYWSRAWFSSA
jgi:hypothetical protein